ncbi:10584_t:CDS:2 [Ambispora gerdemannii]|uniref:10584_t:CDS:1 n=1 Tax=Ambispora gerdemannii TaxID=144530 RepID=A0A9N9FXM1_9GLOM|nr:10584_t:CDS:2 [Ambispora gerdemannii]
MFASLALNLWHLVVLNKIDHNNKNLWMKYCVGSGIIAGLFTALTFLFEMKESKSEGSEIAAASFGVLAGPIGCMVKINAVKLRFYLTPLVIAILTGSLLTTHTTIRLFVIKNTFRDTRLDIKKRGPILFLVFRYSSLPLHWIFPWLNKSKNSVSETNLTSTSTNRIQPDNITIKMMHIPIPRANSDPTSTQLKPHFEQINERNPSHVSTKTDNEFVVAFNEASKVWLPEHRLHFADLQELNAYMEERVANSDSLEIKD